MNNFFIYSESPVAMNFTRGTNAANQISSSAPENKDEPPEASSPTALSVVPREEFVPISSETTAAQSDSSDDEK